MSTFNSTGAAKPAFTKINELRPHSEVKQLASLSAVNSFCFGNNGAATGGLDTLLCNIERDLIRAALQQSQGNCSSAARNLGITRSRLYRRMEVLNVTRDATSQSVKPA